MRRPSTSVIFGSYYSCWFTVVKTRWPNGIFCSLVEYYQNHSEDDELYSAITTQIPIFNRLISSNFSAKDNRFFYDWVLLDIL